MSRLWLAAAGILVLLTLAALYLWRGADSADSSPVVARGNQIMVHLSDLETTDLEDLADRKRVVETAINRMLLAREAERQGLGQRSEVASQLESIPAGDRIRRTALLRDALVADLRSKVDITEEDVVELYERTHARYAVPMVRMRRWQVESREDGEAKRNQALDTSLADEIGPHPLQELPQNILPEAAHLEKPGDRIVAGSEDEGWSLVEMVEDGRLTSRPFERVRTEVESSLRVIRAQQTVRKLLDQAKAEARIEIDEAILQDDQLWHMRTDRRSAA